MGANPGSVMTSSVTLGREVKVCFLILKEGCYMFSFYLYCDKSVQ
jgi:hypothetical protein